MKKVFVKTLGCKVNTFDSQVLENQLVQEGFTLVADPAEADVQVLNSCSVTQKAEQEARYLLRRYQRANPQSKRVITGCYAQISSQSLAKLSEIDLIIPNEAKERLVPLLRQTLEGEAPVGKLPPGVKPVENNRQGHFKTALAFFGDTHNETTRAFLKIQDGCNGFCTYCQIPYARGSSRSVAPAEVLQQVRRLVAQGVKEIVFTGIHIGDYGRDLDTAQPPSFAQLLADIFATPGLARLRISSLEPAEVSQELLEVCAAHADIFCDHFHLPLQSGCDRILKLMRRQYSTERYAETLAMIRRYFPQARLTADVIPGFPGETTEEAESTMEFIRTVGLAGLHVFPYSRRPNTAALRLPDHLEPGIIQQRARELRQLDQELARAFAEPWVGKTVEVLWEEQLDTQGRRCGKSKNYLNMVASQGFTPTRGSITRNKIHGFCGPQNMLVGSPTFGESPHDTAPPKEPKLATIYDRERVGL